MSGWSRTRRAGAKVVEAQRLEARRAELARAAAVVAAQVALVRASVDQAAGEELVPMGELEAASMRDTAVGRAFGLEDLRVSRDGRVMTFVLGGLP